MIIHEPHTVVEIRDLVGRMIRLKQHLCVVGGQTSCQKQADDSVSLLSLDRLPNDIQLFPEDLTVIVPAQMKIRQFDQYLQKNGFFLPLDVPFAEQATIGGMTATNSLGLRSACFGDLRRFILGMDVISATGDAMRLGGMTIKNVVGYDLVQFLVGSYGDYAIITHLIFKLRPLFPQRVTLLCHASEENISRQLMAEMYRQMIQPARWEWLNSSAAETIDNLAAQMMIEIVGTEQQIEAQLKQILAIGRKLSTDMKSIEDVNRQDEVWTQRIDIWKKIHNNQDNYAVIEFELKPTRPAFLPLFESLDDAVAVFGCPLSGHWYMIVQELNSVDDLMAKLGKQARILNGIRYGDPPALLSAPEMGEDEKGLRSRLKQAFDPHQILRRWA